MKLKMKLTHMSSDQNESIKANFNSYENKHIK